MIYSEQELAAIQHIEAEILRHIANICQKHGIQFFLVSGTLLGARRHQGFIPWDDDIDIGLVREEYNRFLQIVPKELGDDYFMQTIDSDPGSPFPYIKIRKNNTTFIEWCNRKLHMHKGVYIDVFPYDNIPDDETLRRRQFKRVKKWQKLYAYRCSPDVSSAPVSLTGRCKRVIRLMLHGICHGLPKRFIFNRLHRSMSLYNTQQTQSVACLLVPRYMAESMQRDVLFPLSSVAFGNTVYPAPAKVDVYLQTVYGNFMELPPPENRVGHKPFQFDIGQ